MSDDAVIKVDNLSKQYRIGVQKGYQTFRETLVDIAQSPFDCVKSFLSNNSKDNNSNLNKNHLFWALKDVSFQVKQGEVVGIIGRNGAGKSTLLKILSKITSPTEGRVELRGRVGSLLEVGTGFHPELTGHENIYLYGAILGMDRWEVSRKFDEIIAFAELEKFIETPVKRYSSGMYMRLAFSVAAHLEPEILLVDEVLAVGDTAFQNKCLGKMGSVSSEGRTVLFVSHNMAAVQGLCSKCYMIDQGKFVTEGEPKKVIEHYLVNLDQTAPESLSDRIDREGSGEIKFTGISIRDSKGNPIEYALSGQDISFVLSYHSENNKPVSRSDIHLTFYSVFGQFMFNCSSEGSGYPFDLLPPQGEVVCTIPELPLAPGRYVFNLFSTVGGGIADWIKQAGELKVQAGDFFGTGHLKTHDGGFLVKNRWEIK